MTSSRRPEARAEAVSRESEALQTARNALDAARDNHEEWRMIRDLEADVAFWEAEIRAKINRKIRDAAAARERQKGAK